MESTYDVLIIGSGTAGQTAAYELKSGGMTVGVVEQSQQPGGTCALSGCQAKKWFYEGAATVARSRHLNRIGIELAAVGNWSQLRDAKNQFTRNVPSNTINGLKGAGIDFIAGPARFVDGDSIDVDGRRLTARFIVIATGARPMRLPIDGTQHMVSSTEFMERQRLPRRIVFIGGGFISFEFAHFAARLGPPDIRCVILEAAHQPLAAFDNDMVDLLVDASQGEGIEIHTNFAASTVAASDGCFTVRTEDGRRFDTDLVVHGAGRVADIEDLALDRAGVDVTPRGITVADTMATSAPGIYAIGDCADTVQLARVADAEAQTAAANILKAHHGKGHDHSMDYTAVPAALFTYPQLGMVGATEKQLKDKGVAYRKGFATGLGWPTYRRIGLHTAAYKLLVGEEDGLILGAHVLSDSATGLIYAFALAMHNRIPVDRLYRQSVMTPYPSRESDIIYMLKPLMSKK